MKESKAQRPENKAPSLGLIKPGSQPAYIVNFAVLQSRRSSALDVIDVNRTGHHQGR